ncbi:hypothetical protein B0H21DRAFT_531893 [Amylocystis lapponica]|nr:hypothetical protein B0H21DRAFT_531893 [Amylocystis lapponica]
MQAQHYQNGEPYYPPTQYAPPQTTYYTHFTPYYSTPPYPPPQNAASYPYYYEPPLSQVSPEMSAPKPRKKSNRNRSGSGSTAPALSTPTRSGTPGAPLKSALKKPPAERTPSAASVSLSRHRTNSDSRPRVNSLTRQRSNTQPPFQADHIFVSLHSINELRVDNIAYQSTLDELRESVLPMWPRGVATEESRDSQWRVRFIGKPWTTTGIDGILAQRLLCRLYMVLANQGYFYQATINTANPTKPARLIFAVSPAEPPPDPLIFLTTFSRSADKLTLVDAPQDIVQQLGASLRNVFPRRVASYGANLDGIHVIELKSAGFRTTAVEKNLFNAYILKFFNSAGFRLDGSVPMGRRGTLGLGTRKEIWVFRGAAEIRRPESRQKQKQ